MSSVNIAMFGTRSTGKTNFLASLVGVDAVQGCSINFQDTDTRKVLSGYWRRLLEGELPSATAMVDMNAFSFDLLQKVQGKIQDEVSWRVQIKDYAGKLAEEDEENPDFITLEVKKQLEEYIHNADAILFLAPVEMVGWSETRQEFYISYIKNCVSIAKNSRENGRSIPFCLALMKWDTTGIHLAPAAINVSGKQPVAAELEKFMSENPIFQRIHTILNDLSNHEVVVFPVSAYGAHNPNDKTLPDPHNLRPFNILQILHWFCVRTEAVNQEKLHRKIEIFLRQEDSREKFEKIDKAYQEFLSQGTTDADFATKVEQDRSENWKKYIAFYQTVFEDSLNKIENDLRSKNKWLEKSALYQKRLERKLFLPEDERELRHDLNDLKVKAKKRNYQLWFWKFVMGTSIIVMLALVSWGALLFVNMSSYTNGESILNVDEAHLTAQKFNAAEPFFSMFYCPLENWIPGIAGRRDNFEIRKRKFTEKFCKELNAAVEAIPVSGTCIEKAEAFAKKILLIQSSEKDPKMFADVYRAKFIPMITSLEKEKKYYDDAALLEVRLLAIQGAEKFMKLAEIEKSSEFDRTRFHEPESQLF